MNKELAGMLKLKIATLPFLQGGIVAGLVQTVENEIFAEETNAKTIQRFPVSYDVLGPANCGGQEKDLQPDSTKRVILYFEDFGSRVIQSKVAYTDMSSNLRLICWLNRHKLVGDNYQEITAPCVNALLGRLVNRNPRNLGMFTRLTASAAAIPAQNAALFNRYTYDEKIRQYLRPPFEFFGIDLVCNYRIATSCITPLTIIETPEC